MLAPELCSFCGGSLTTWAGEHRSARVRTRAQTKGTRGLASENVPRDSFSSEETRTESLFSQATPQRFTRRRAAQSAARGIPATPAEAGGCPRGPAWTTPTARSARPCSCEQAEASRNSTTTSGRGGSRHGTGSPSTRTKSRTSGIEVMIKLVMMRGSPISLPYQIGAYCRIT